MKKGFKKLSIEIIFKMKELFNKGWSYSKIGREIGVGHTTVLYWSKRGFEKKKHGTSIRAFTKFPKREILVRKKYESVIRNKPIIKIARKKFRDKRKMRVEINKNSNLNICFQCGKEKEDKKWKLTHFCSLNCFKSLFPEKVL